MIMFIPSIYLSLFVLWLCLDSKFTMSNCGLGYYITHMLYWQIYSNILCSLCDKIITSFWNIATSSLWSFIMLTLQAKQQWWNFSRSCSMHKASLSMLLYLDSMLFRLFLEVLLAKVLHCKVLHFLETISPPSLAELALKPNPTNLFLGTAVLFDYRMQPFWWLLFLWHTGVETCCSMSICSLIM